MRKYHETLSQGVTDSHSMRTYSSSRVSWTLVSSDKRRFTYDDACTYLNPTALVDITELPQPDFITLLLLCLSKLTWRLTPGNRPCSSTSLLKSLLSYMRGCYTGSLWSKLWSAPEQDRHYAPNTLVAHNTSDSLFTALPPYLLFPSPPSSSTPIPPSILPAPFHPSQAHSLLSCYVLKSSRIHLPPSPLLLLTSPLLFLFLTQSYFLEAQGLLAFRLSPTFYPPNIPSVLLPLHSHLLRIRQS